MKATITEVTIHSEGLDVNSEEEQQLHLRIWDVSDDHHFVELRRGKNNIVLDWSEIKLVYSESEKLFAQEGIKPQ